MTDGSPDRSSRPSRRHGAGRSPDPTSDGTSGRPSDGSSDGSSGGSLGGVGEKVGEAAGSVGTAARGAQRHATKAARSEPVRKGARVGIAANGILHLLIAWLALQVALGGGGQADQRGAVTTLAQQPFGRVLLWVLFVGFVAVVL